MKKIIENNIKVILAFIIGIVITGTVVYASNILASDVSYDNTNSGLTATNAQSAIDELTEKANNIECKKGYAKSTDMIGDYECWETATIGNQVNELVITHSSFTAASVGTYNVKCVNGTIEALDDSVGLYKITANPAPSGYKFIYWVDAYGNIVSNSSSQRLYAVTDNTYTPVYVKSDNELKQKIFINIYPTSQTQDNTLAFTTYMKADIDDSIYQVQEVGTIVTNNPEWANSNYLVATATADLSSANKIAIVKSSTDSKEFTNTLNKGAVGTDTWYGRGWVIIKNLTNNTTETYYTKNIVSIQK